MPTTHSQEEPTVCLGRVVEQYRGLSPPINKRHNKEVKKRKRHTGKRRIMLDTIMLIQILKIERILAIALVQHPCAVVGHEETETRRKVVRGADFLVELLE
jgi:hypothetical protein